MSYDDTPTLLAIDPYGCGCTECLTGEYKPLNMATDEDIQRLLAGELTDNTDEHWLIDERTYGYDGVGGFFVNAHGRSFDVDRIKLPIQVEHYRINLSKATFEEILSGGGYPQSIGKDA